MNYPIVIISKTIKNAFDYIPRPPIAPRPPGRPPEPRKPPESYRIFLLITIVFVLVFFSAFIKTNTEPFLTGLFGGFCALFFGFLTRVNERENEEYPNQYLKYQTALRNYAVEKEKFLKKLEEHNKEKSKYENSYFVNALKKDMYENSLGDFTQPYIVSKSENIYSMGKSEVLFFKQLASHFPNKVYNNMHFKVYDIEYKPDMIYRDDLIIIDIEIDEPYILKTGEPIHHISSDDYRNECFTEAGWNVVRFTEKQVVTEPHKCIEYLEQLIYLIKQGNIDSINSLIRPKEDPQWTIDEAHKMAYKRLRETY